MGVDPAMVMFREADAGGGVPVVRLSDILQGPAVLMKVRAALNHTPSTLRPKPEPLSLSLVRFSDILQGPAVLMKVNSTLNPTTLNRSTESATRKRSPRTWQRKGAGSARRRTRMRSSGFRARPVQGNLAHKKPPPSGPYTRAMPRALWWPYGGGVFYERGAPVQGCIAHKKPPPPPRTTIGPRRRPTVGSYGGRFLMSEVLL
ncbi:hypothetical protein T484DRAFT_1980610 [Baffinella frigidus]|nr:hypothetical protein T484DRAFT_1980610 [Cryptophyta sp. CCMP2293]